jgi:hypothetical protein
MAPGISSRKRSAKAKEQAGAQKKRKREDVDVEKLEEAVAELVRSPTDTQYTHTYLDLHIQVFI